MARLIHAVVPSQSYLGCAWFVAAASASAIPDHDLPRAERGARLSCAPSRAGPARDMSAWSPGFDPRAEPALHCPARLRSVETTSSQSTSSRSMGRHARRRARQFSPALCAGFGSCTTMCGRGGGRYKSAARRIPLTSPAPVAAASAAANSDHDAYPAPSAGLHCPARLRARPTGARYVRRA